MDELSLYILDIAYNSIRAKATHITIKIIDSIKDNIIHITIKDDGTGMSEEMVNKVIDPFYTTRTTRKVGLGIPMLKQNAELTGGYLNITSKENVGTTIDVTFIKDNIDTPVMGDLIESILTLIQADESIDYYFEYTSDEGNFILDTNEMKEILGEVPINEPEVLLWIKDYMKEGLYEIIR
ncbi:MAG: ATP-binding protein [Erysipelotrichaceae bacterium]|nr:ATP-binding protein [Erysipelotrichaceae bacterium]